MNHERSRNEKLPAEELNRYVPWPLGEGVVLRRVRRFSDEHKGSDHQPTAPARTTQPSPQKLRRRTRSPTRRSPTRTDSSFDSLSSHSSMLPRNRARSCERPDVFLPLRPQKSPLRRAKSGNGIRVIAVVDAAEYKSRQQQTRDFRQLNPPLKPARRQPSRSRCVEQ